ncbi:MAG: molybdopterin-dependent oxidoreductase [Pseudomonadota bacterium]
MARNLKKGNMNDHWVHTVCAQCYGSCGMAVKVVDGVALKVEGEPDSYMGSRGGLCGKGFSNIMGLYDPNRIRYPLKRTNPEKGMGVDPKWERISWDEAMNTIAEKHKRL